MRHKTLGNEGGVDIIPWTATGLHNQANQNGDEAGF
jgi:hypothetical protein